ncbi:squalene/phytoene synthase family protein [Brevundimonas sp.]|uniref:squalene/phytoene synthase family protein n=1 Tax=Brevundimonas sp. TaxID=1871086 RepID=UPI0025DBCB21|nr:squalene/phytoene synthase family protein [Brevundimonas sp.]
MTAAYDFDGKVRLADPDRWMSSRFISDEAARADLMVLYALEAELAAIPTKVVQPMLAEMRYAWWREQLDGVFTGEPRRGHPLLEALAGVVERGGLERAAFEALIEAHIGRAHGEPHDITGLFVAPMQMATRVLVGGGHEAAVAAAGEVWGLTMTGRAAEAEALRPAANTALKRLPARGFPAVAHAALARLDRAEALKRLRLVWAVARGRI